MGIVAGQMRTNLADLEAGLPQDASGTSVTALIRQAKSGDRHALEQVILAHQDQVLRMALALLGDRDDAMDAAQEVLLRLCRYLNRFDDERRLLPWLYRMVVNVCHDMRRKKRCGTTISLDADGDCEALTNLASSSDPQAEQEHEEARRMIHLALETLTEKERTALVLRDIEGLPTREVARILGVTEGTVRSQISAARLKIKKFRDRFLRRQIPLLERPREKQK